LGALEPKFWLTFLERVGRAELAPLAVGSEADRARLRSELRSIFSSRSRDEWQACLGDQETCFAPVLSLDEARRDPQAQALGLFEATGIAPPFTFSETSTSARRVPPKLGEHTAEILTELGLATTDINELAAGGVV
jgi:alpha-methylacyl-CoA racemase